MASLENKSGKFVKPSLESGQAALANVEMPEDLRAWLPDPDGEEAYPIVSYTWLLCYKKYDDPQKAETLKNVVKYCLTDGQKMSDEMGYVPLPENVVAKVTQRWTTFSSPVRKGSARDFTGSTRLVSDGCRFGRLTLADDSVASPPSSFDISWDRAFRGLTYLFSWLTILLVLYILYEIGGKGGSGDPGIWCRFHHGNHLGRESRRVRCLAGDLGNAVQFDPGA